VIAALGNEKGGQRQIVFLLAQRSKPEGRRRVSGAVHADATTKRGCLSLGHDANSNRGEADAGVGRSNLVLVRPITFHFETIQACLAGTNISQQLNGANKGDRIWSWCVRSRFILRQSRRGWPDQCLSAIERCKQGCCPNVAARHNLLIWCSFQLISVVPPNILPSTHSNCFAIRARSHLLDLGSEGELWTIGRYVGLDLLPGC
jgi:hypothetical protein